MITPLPYLRYRCFGIWIEFLITTQPDTYKGVVQPRVQGGICASVSVLVWEDYLSIGGGFKQSDWLISDWRRVARLLLTTSGSEGCDCKVDDKLRISIKRSQNQLCNHTSSFRSCWEYVDAFIKDFFTLWTGRPRIAGSVTSGLARLACLMFFFVWPGHKVRPTSFPIFTRQRLTVGSWVAVFVHHLITCLKLVWIF